MLKVPNSTFTQKLHFLLLLSYTTNKIYKFYLGLAGSAHNEGARVNEFCSKIHTLFNSFSNSVINSSITSKLSSLSLDVDAITNWKYLKFQN